MRETIFSVVRPPWLNVRLISSLFLQHSFARYIINKATHKRNDTFSVFLFLRSLSLSLSPISLRIQFLLLLSSCSSLVVWNRMVFVWCMPKLIPPSSTNSTHTQIVIYYFRRRSLFSSFHLRSTAPNRKRCNLGIKP